jgi:elongation factor Ts
MISTEQVKELRTRTSCGIVDCQQALVEAKGDIEGAIKILRQKGKAKAVKKAERATHEGMIATYIHTNGKMGAMVALLCETDFVARNVKFQDLARSIALHIAAMDPAAVHPEEISTDAIEAERAIAQEQAAKSGKPPEIQEKMIEGKLKKFKEEKALLTQPYVKDPTRTVGDLVHEAISELGENITIGGFARLTI